MAQKLARINIEQRRLKLKDVNYFEVEDDVLVVWLEGKDEAERYTITDKEKMIEVTDKIQDYWNENN